MKKKIYLYFTLVIAFFTFLIALFIYHSKTQRAIAKSEITLREKSLQITHLTNSYFQKIESELVAIVQTQEIEKITKDLENGFQKGVQSLEYKKSSESLIAYLSSLGKNYLFDQLVYVSAGGDVIYGEGVGSNIYKDSFDNSDLIGSLMRSALTQTIDISKISFNSAKQREEIYFTLPLGNTKRILSFCLNLTPFQRKIATFEEDLALFQMRDHIPVILISDFSANEGEPFFLAMEGREGASVTKIANKRVVAAWNFITQLNWGLVIKMDYSILTAPFQYIKDLAYIALALFIICLLIVLWTPIKKLLFAPYILPVVSIVLLLFFLFGIAYSILGFHNARKNSILREEKEISKRLLDFIASTSSDISNITHTADWIAKDINNGRLKQKDFLYRLNREFQETLSLQKMIIAYEPPPHLALEIARKDNDIVSEEISHQSYADQNWFVQGLEKKNEWLILTNELANEQGVYIAPFQTDQKGMVVSFYDISSLTQELNELPLGFSGKALLFLEEGLIPGSDISVGKVPREEFFTFRDNRSNEKVHFIVEKIPYTPWLIVGLFKETNIQSDIQEIHRYIFILVTSLLLTVILLLSIFCKRRALFSWLYVIVTAAALLTLWIVKHINSEHAQVQGLIVRDKVELNNFISMLKKNASQMLVEEPILLPTGIKIDFIELQSSNYLTFSGIAWQKYPQEMENMQITFPQASAVTLDKISTKDSPLLLKSWRVRATLAQNRDRSAFPFDNYLIKIQLGTLNENPALCLIPDLASYKNYSPQSNPGINANFTVPGYTLTQSFFSLEKENSDSQIEFITGKSRDRYTLFYNIFLVRNFLTPFIPFLIPLIVIQIGMYGIFLMTKKEKKINFMSSISAYTGGFFAFAILQLNLRTHYAGDSILYAETFFFVGYFSICLLYAHAILIKNSPQDSRLNRAKPILNLLFWPMEVTLWYIIFILYFY